VGKAEENLKFLRQETGVHVHVDLIVGLPGETAESFGAGFDRLVGLDPQEIQVGMLKRLRGTPIVRHDAQWGMVYSPEPPYEVLQTGAIEFGMMQRLRRLARYWDLVSNSGNFVESARLMWEGGSPFARFLHFSDWVFERGGKNYGIALSRLSELVFEFLTGELGREAEFAARAVWRDYQRGGRSDRPWFLLKHLAVEEMKVERGVVIPRAVKRQMRRLGK
jgi:hypothetical protein